MAIEKVLIINDETLRFFTAINQNVDTKLLRPNILIAQDYHLQRITGTKLYNTLQQQVATETIVESYTTLLDEYVYDF